MSAGQQVARGGMRIGAIVGEDEIPIDAPRSTVHKHHRQPCSNFAEQVAVIGACRGQDDAVHPASGKGLDESPFTLLVLFQTGRKHPHVQRTGDVLHSAVNSGEKGVANILDQQADGRGALIRSAQVACREVQAEVQLLGGPADPPLQVPGDPRLPVHHPGDGLEAHSGQGSHVPHSGPRPRLHP